MKSFRYKITEETGVHARPAGMLVKEAQKFDSNIQILAGEKRAEATKLIALMALGIKCGQEVEVVVEGSDEEEAVSAMQLFFKQNL